MLGSGTNVGSCPLLGVSGGLWAQPMAKRLLVPCNVPPALGSRGLSGPWPLGRCFGAGSVSVPPGTPAATAGRGPGSGPAPSSSCSPRMAPN